jgi:hypothetical protein
MTDSTNTRAYTPQTVPCIVCRRPLDVRLTKGRKSGKPSIMLICPENGRHLRAFVTDQAYVRGVLDRIDGAGTGEKAGGGPVPTMDKVGNSDGGANTE